MTDVNRIAQVERSNKRLHVLDIGVHVIAGVGLGRAAVAAAIVGDDAIALAEEEHQLIVPVVGAQWPAMMKNDGLRGFRAPVLVENVGAVRRGDGGHVPLPHEGRPAGPVPKSQRAEGAS